MLFWNRGWPLDKVTLATGIHTGSRAARVPALCRYATGTRKLTNSTPTRSARQLRWNQFDSAPNKKPQGTHEISNRSNGLAASHADARAQLSLHSKRHAGTRLDLDPKKRASYYRPTKLDDRLTALVHAFTKTDAVFVCLDLEAYEHDKNMILEVGVSTLDTRDLVEPDLTGCVWWDKIRSYHFRIQENVHLINQDWIYGDPDSFLFGATQQVSQASALDSCRKLLMRGGVHDHRPERKVFLVGHALGNDKIFLNTLGLDLRRETPNIIGEIDTQKFGKTPHLKLSRLLDSLEIPHAHLHNAGNDATYTLRALCLIAAQDLGSDDRSGSAWNSVDGSDISSEESWLGTDSQILQSRPKPGPQTIMPLEKRASSARILEWHEAYKETAEDVRIVSENLFMSRELNGLAPRNSNRRIVRASWKMSLSERRASRLRTHKYLRNKLRQQSPGWKFPDSGQRNLKLEYMCKLAEFNVIQEELFLLTGRTSFSSDKDLNDSLPFRNYPANTNTNMNTMLQQRLERQAQINEAIESELKMLVPGWTSPILRTNDRAQSDSISVNLTDDTQRLAQDIVTD